MNGNIYAFSYKELTKLDKFPLTFMEKEYDCAFVASGEPKEIRFCFRDKNKELEFIIKHSQSLTKFERIHED